MPIRDRIRDFRRVRARELRPHPRNWRTHPELQRIALKGLLAEIGYAAALVARQLPDGALELIDGHLRAETTPDQEVPVLVVDLDEAEGAKLLALHDPLAGLAGVNSDVWAGLIPSIHTEDDAVREVLDRMLGSPDQALENSPSKAAPEVGIPETYQIVVECADEAQQKELFERLTAEGYVCRLLNL